MAAVKGYVEKIKYRNEDNGYSVLSVTAPTTGKNIFWSAISLIFRKWELVKVAGRMTEHQFTGSNTAVEL